MVFCLDLKVKPHRLDSNRSNGLGEIATCPYWRRHGFDRGVLSRRIGFDGLDSSGDILVRTKTDQAANMFGISAELEEAVFVAEAFPQSSLK
jgi:hypothetical protein